MGIRLTIAEPGVGAATLIDLPLSAHIPTRGPGRIAVKTTLNDMLSRLSPNTVLPVCASVEVLYVFVNHWDSGQFATLGSSAR